MIVFHVLTAFHRIRAIAFAMIGVLGILTGTFQVLPFVYIYKSQLCQISGCELAAGGKCAISIVSISATVLWFIGGLMCVVVGGYNAVDDSRK